MALVSAAKHHIVGIVVEHHLVGKVAAALGETQVIYSIEHIGLTHSIIADKAINVGRKIQLTFSEILEVYY